MLVQWGRFVARARWWVLLAAVALVAAGATWGTGVFGVLTGGGFTDPDSESTIAQERILEEIGDRDFDLVVLYSHPDTAVTDPAFADAVGEVVEALKARPEVVQVLSWYETGAPNLVSHDQRATYLAVQLAPDDEDELLEAYRGVAPLLPADGLVTQVGGAVVLLEESNIQTEKDVVRAELLSFPVLLLLLVLVFRSLVAAAAPLVVGGLAILGAFLATRLLTMVTEVSIFAINVITVIGLGLAIDYALLIVNRFREELRAGHPVDEAVARTMATAGRSVFVSAVTTVLALASLLIFPQVFLRSMALGGMSAITVAMLGALTVLPALLAVLGPRIDAGRVRLPRLLRRRGTARVDDPAAAVGEPLPEGSDDGAWARVARAVMRRPWPVLVGATALLVLLASPAWRVELGGFDERVLPPGAESRTVSERIAQEFPGGVGEPIKVLISGADQPAAQEFADRVAALTEVTGVSLAAGQGTSWLLEVTYPGSPTGDAAWDAVRAVRDLPPPAGAEVLVGGRTAFDVDMVDSLAEGLPVMLVIMIAVIMLVLFLAFGSVVLPVKAVLMNLLSIGAAVGVVVWGFQDGHLADLLGFTSTGFIQPAMLVLLLAVLFGLSTDYEVFLLSRVREHWDHTGDNTAAVAHGLQRTGRIITAAALLLIVVVGGFAAGEMAYVKLLGVGMIVAVALDATVIRILLVPAVMRLLGRWNWWAPGPLSRVYRRFRLEGPEAADVRN